MVIECEIKTKQAGLRHGTVTESPSQNISLKGNPACDYEKNTSSRNKTCPAVCLGRPATGDFWGRDDDYESSHRRRNRHRLSRAAARQRLRASGRAISCY